MLFRHDLSPVDSSSNILLFSNPPRLLTTFSNRWKMMQTSNSFQLVAASLLMIALSAVGFGNVGQDQPKPQTTAPEAEMKAAAAINSAPDAAAKLQAAEAFVKKYPKSTLRLEVAQLVTNEIARLTDAGQRLTLGERFLKTFSGDGESDRIKTLVIGDYVTAKRVDVKVEDMNQASSEVRPDTDAALLAQGEIRYARTLELPASRGRGPWTRTWPWSWRSPRGRGHGSSRPSSGSAST